MVAVSHSQEANMAGLTGAYVQSGGVGFRLVLFFAWSRNLTEKRYPLYRIAFQNGSLPLADAVSGESRSRR